MLEFKPAFHVITWIISLCVTVGCSILLQSAICTPSLGNDLALAVFIIASPPGISRLIVLFVPLILSRIWPEI